MGKIQFTEIGDFEQGFGENPDAWDTRELALADPLGYAVRGRLRKDGLSIFNESVLITTLSCWSGYTEYSITNTWTEVVITVPACEWERRFGGLPEFFAWVAEYDDGRAR